MNNTIAYLGKKGSFSYAKALEHFGEDKLFIGGENFENVFKFIEEERAHCAIVPIENSLIGSIYENYDLLYSYKFFIIGETYKKIEHYLLCAPEKKLSNEERIRSVKYVFSHPKALEQCSNFFLKHPWIKTIMCSDTATATEKAAEKNSPHYAAIAGMDAAKIYRLDIVKKSLANNPNNITRFINIRKKDPLSIRQANKCSLIIRLLHAPNALSKVLTDLSSKKANLTKVESRPIPNRPFEYIFYLDFEFPEKQFQEIREIIKNIKKKTKEFILLGFYKKETLWTN